MKNRSHSHPRFGLLMSSHAENHEYLALLGAMDAARELDITELKKTTVRLQQEVAERHRVEAQLRESEEHYRNLFERLQDVCS